MNKIIKLVKDKNMKTQLQRIEAMCIRIENIVNELLLRSAEKNTLESAIADLHSRVDNAVNLLHTFVRENPDKLIANELKKPPINLGDFRLITDDGKLKTSKLLAECRKLFPVYSYWNDKQLDEYFPPPDTQTIHKFRNVQEADEQWANKSADDLEKLWGKRFVFPNFEKIIGDKKGITLREMLIFHLQYYKETGNHLDVENITLCTGSRGPGGRVPGVRWCGGGLGVDWFSPSSAYGGLRVREQLK